MRGSRFPLGTVLGALPLLTALAAAPASAQYAPEQQLGALPGGTFSTGAGINDLRQVAGAADTTSGTAGFLWTSAAGLERALAAACASGSASDVNGAGLVVGTCSLADGTTRGFTWSHGQPGALLALPTGATESAAQSVSEQGVVAGSASRASPTSGLAPTATLWDAKGQPRTLPMPTGASSSVASEVGASGDAVGQFTATDATGIDRMLAVLWPASGGTRVLSRPAGHDDAIALGVDGKGDAVGYSLGFGADGSFELSGHVWNVDGTRSDLPFLGAGRYTVPLDLNDRGEVVGFAYDENWTSHAFVWTPAAGLTLLDASVGAGGSANAIAADGSITGTQVRADGSQVAFLLAPLAPTPTPTPTPVPPPPPADTVAPQSLASVWPMPNVYGWNRTDVAVTITAEDAGSGVRELLWSVAGGTLQVTSGARVETALSGDGVWPVSHVAVDNAGNVEREGAALPVRIDTTAPTLVHAFSATPQAGWFRAPVTVRFAAKDGLSGLDAVSPPVTVSAAGVTTVNGTASDRAGNVAALAVPVRIDAVPPVVSVKSSTKALWPPNHQMVDVRFTGRVADALSGPHAVRLEVTCNERDDEHGDDRGRRERGDDGWTRPVVVTASLDATGAFEVTIPLRAERSGKLGRTYRVTAFGDDVAGNAASTMVEVRVVNAVQLLRH